MRVDKFLKVSRLIKRRTVANNFCTASRIKVNGTTVKPSFNVKVGDIITIIYETKELNFKVLLVDEIKSSKDTKHMYEQI